MVKNSYLCTMRVMLILVGLLVVVLAGTSLLDIATGVVGTAQRVYHSLAFHLLWLMVVVKAGIYIYRRKLWRRRLLFTIHIALLLVILGTGITSVFSVHGTVHLREDHPLDAFITDASTVRELGFTMTFDSFEVAYYPDRVTPQDYITTVRVSTRRDTTVHHVAMNHILTVRQYRFYAMSYDTDHRGSSLLVSYDPIGITVTYLGYALLLLSLTVLLLSRLSRRTIIGILSTIVLVIVAAFIMLPTAHLTWLQPVLNTPLLVLHVGTISIAYCLFITLFLLSVIALTALITPKQGGHNIVLSLRRLCSKLLITAVYLLTMGIIIGAIWANNTWGTYWSWDAKETWALITLIVYAIPMHSTMVPWLRRDSVFFVYLAIAIIAVVMTFFGANYLIPGLHSYV